jgi:hypothetical protein
MFVRYGLGDELQDQIKKYQRALHDLATAIDMARRAGQEAAAEQLRRQFDALKLEVDRLVAKKYGQEMPSKLALGIANIGEGFATSVRNVAVVVAIGIGAALILPAVLARRGR